MKSIPCLFFTVLLAFGLALSAHAGPIGKGGFVITKPGKYFLLRNIVVAAPRGGGDPIGIVIKSSDVELDLAGYSIRPAAGQQGQGFAILIDEGTANLRLHNGRLSDFQFGIFATSGNAAAVTGSVFEDLQITGCTQAGISLGAAACTVRHCTISGSGTLGIQFLTFTGSFNEVTDSTVLGLGMTTGIHATGLDGLVVRHCTVTGCTTGIGASSGCKLFNNVTLGCATAITGNPLLIGTND